METNPILALLFSGKRKSGKDKVTDILCERLGDVAVNIKISAPIKLHFAKIKNLDYDDLLSDGTYKENYRLEMIKWSEAVRSKDFGYFCRAAVDMFQADKKPIWIVSDIRRRSDIQWFRTHFNNAIKLIRIVADEDIRKSRGWTFTEGIDDKPSECDLDSVDDWDLVIYNNTSLEDLDAMIDKIILEVGQELKKNNYLLTYD